MLVICRATSLTLFYIRQNTPGYANPPHHRFQEGYRVYHWGNHRAGPVLEPAYPYLGIHQVQSEHRLHDISGRLFN